MKSSSPPFDAVPGARTPLRIVVSPSGQHAALKALVAQCVPVVQNPEAFPSERRRELAQRLARAIQPRGDTEEPEATSLDSEPTLGDAPCRWIDEP